MKRITAVVDLTVPKFSVTDNPSCPKCGNYNAMLEHWDEIKGEFYRKCRDCGYEANSAADKICSLIPKSRPTR